MGFFRINGHNEKEIFKALKKHKIQKNQLLFHAKQQLDMVLQTKVEKLLLMEVHWVKMKLN